MIKMYSRQQEWSYSEENENFKGLTKIEADKVSKDQNIIWKEFAGLKRMSFGYKKLESEVGFPFELYMSLNYGDNYYVSKGSDGMAWYQPEPGNMSGGLPAKVLIKEVFVSVPYVKIDES